MSKLDDIANGYGNLAKDKLGLLTKKQSKLFSNRMAICQACEFKTELGRCRKCGCVLTAKTKCEDCKCPADKW